MNVKRASRTLRPQAPWLVLVMAILLSTLTGGAGAFAADPPAATPPPATTAAPPAGTEVHSWALAPSGSDPSQPSSRPNFSYALQPGATIQDAATLWNYSTVQLTFHVYATDGLNTPTGEFSLLTGQQKAEDVGTWIKVAQEFVTVPAQTSIVLPVTVTVPTDAKPGDHAGGIVASSQTAQDSGGKDVTLDRRAGSRVYLRVNGPVNPGMTVEDLRSTYHPALNPLDGSLDVRYTVRNTGNIRMSAHQVVHITDLFGGVADRKPKDIPELLPGNAITQTQHFTGVAATVRVGSSITLEPFAGATTTIETPTAKLQSARTSTSVHTWAVPWTLIVVLMVLVLLITLLRRRRRKKGALAIGPGSNGGGGPALPEPAPAPRTPLSVRSVWVMVRGGPATT